MEHCVALVDENMDLEVPYKQHLDHVREVEAPLQQPYVHNQVVWLGLCFEKVVFFVELLDMVGHVAVAAASGNSWDNSLSNVLY